MVHATLAKVALTPEPQVIEQSVEALGTIGTQLGLGPAESAESRRSLVPDGNVPSTFVDVALTVASTHPSLVGDNFDADAVRDAQAYLLAMQPVAGAMRTLLKQTEDELIRRRAIIGTQSRALYKFLDAIATTARGAPIREPLDRMTQAMRLGPRQQAEPAPAPAPVDPTNK